MTRANHPKTSKYSSSWKFISCSILLAAAQVQAQDASGICQNFPVTTDRKCGPDNGGKRCPQPPVTAEVQACSQYGYCVPPSDPEWPLAAYAGCLWQYGVCMGQKPNDLNCNPPAPPSNVIPLCSGYTIGQGGRCGKDQGGTRCADGYCCSPYGWCGLASQIQGPEYCQLDKGCQLGYGICFGQGVPSCTVGPQPTTSSVPSTKTTLTPTSLTTSIQTSIPTSVSTTTTIATKTTGSVTTTSTSSPTSTVIQSPFPENLLPPTCSSYYLPPTSTPQLNSTVVIPTEVPQDCLPPTPREDVVYSKGLLDSDAGTAVKATAGGLGAAAAGAWGFGEWYTRNRIAKL